MFFKRKPRNRRHSRGHVLEVKLSSLQRRRIHFRRLKWTLLSALVLFGTLYGGWRGGEYALDRWVFNNEHFAISRVEVETGQKPFFIGGDKYNLAAEIGFYLQRPADCVNLYAFGARGLGYRYWTDLRQYEGRPAVVVLLNLKPALLRDLQTHFTKCSEPQPVQTAITSKRQIGRAHV